MGTHKNKYVSPIENTNTTSNINNFNSQKTGSRGYNKSQVHPNGHINSENSMMASNQNGLLGQ